MFVSQEVLSLKVFNCMTTLKTFRVGGYLKIEIVNKKNCIFWQLKACYISSIDFVFSPVCTKRHSFNTTSKESKTTCRYTPLLRMNKLSSTGPKEQITASSPPHFLKKKGYKIPQKITTVLTAPVNEVFSVDIYARYRIVGRRYSLTVT